MSNFWMVATQVVVLFALMSVGALARRARLVTDAAIDGLVNILLLVVTPCVIVESFLRPFDPTTLGSLAAAFAIAVFGHILAIGVATLLIRHPVEDTRKVLRMCAIFSNAGFMGIPLEQAILGETGVFFGVAYIVVFNLAIWSWGYWQMGGKGLGFKAVVNPGTLGLAIGLPLFLLSIRLPTMLAEPVRHLADLNTPLAMVVIGYTLAGARLGRALRVPMVYLTAGQRLVLHPLLMAGALFLMRSHFDRTMMLAMIIASAAPSAAFVSMLAVKFNRDPDISVAVVSGTTLLSLITIPPVIAFAMAIL